MGITLNTLYRWRNEEKAKVSAPVESAAEAIPDTSDKISAAKVILSEYDASIAAENVKLTEEIAKLRAENNKLRNALKALLG